MKRSHSAVFLSGVLALSLALFACGGSGGSQETTQAPAETTVEAPAEEPQVQAPNLDGMWLQEGRTVNDEGMMGAIDGDTIALWFHTDEMNADYWIGTFEAPTSDADYTWTSIANKELMTGLLCSQDDSKEFSYSGGKISFDVTIQGDTTNVVMEQANQQSGLLAEALNKAQEQTEATADIKDLVLEDYGYVLSHGYVEYALAITNPNEGAAPEFAHVNIVGRKADGSIRFSDDWVVGSTAPGETTYWASQAGSGDVEESDTVEITVKVDEDDWFVTTQPGDYYLIENTSTEVGSWDNLKTTGEITLKEDVELETFNDVKSPMIVCILKDADGKIISGYTTFVSSDLTVGQPQAFEVTSMFDAVDYATAEVYANPW